MSASRARTLLQLPTSLEAQLLEFRRRVWIVKSIEATLVTAYEADYFKVPLDLEEYEEYSAEKIDETISQLERDMREAAKRFEFERAAELRDRIKYLRERELQVT